MNLTSKHLMIVSLLLLALLQAVASAQSPDLLAEPGQSVTLSWTLPDLTGFTVLKIFNASNNNIAIFIVFYSNTVAGNTFDASRFTYLGDTRQRKMTFSLRHVSRWDAGSYLCGRDGFVYIFPDCGQRLVVLGPPTKPVINSRTVIVEGSDVTLTCQTTSTSVPANHNLTLTYTWTRSGVTLPGVTSHSLLVTNVGRSSTESYTCLATESRGLTSQTSNAYVIDVLYGPVSVALDPPRTSYEVRENTQPVPSFRCQADCRPACSYRWTGPGLDVSSSHSSFPLTRVSRQQAGLFSCTASNLYGSQTSVTVSVTATYVPDVTILVSNCSATNTYTAVAGASLLLTCDVTDANPSTIYGYEWSVPGSGWQTGDRQRQLTVTKSSGGQYACRASNSVGFSSQSSLTLDVQYGPVSVTLDPPRTSYEVRENTQPVPSFRCQANCRPACSYRWTGPGLDVSSSNGSFPLTRVSRQQAGLFSCTASNLYGSQTSVTVSVTATYVPDVTILVSNCSAANTYTAVAGVSLLLTCDVTDANPSTIYGYEWSVPGSGWQTGDRQRQLTVTRSSGGQYFCRASNSVGFSSQSSLTLDVQYPPEVGLSVTQVKVTEGTTVTVQCSVEARPDVTGVWSRQSGSVLPGVQVSSGLVFPSVSREHSGNYSCSASNVLSPCYGPSSTHSASASVLVDVLFLPSVMSLTVNDVSYITVEEGAALSMRCDISSNPLPRVRLVNVTSAGVLKEWSGVSSVQLQLSAECLHTGPYSCDASNFLGSVSVPSPVHLYVTCSPRQDLRVHGIQTTQTSVLGANVTFTLPLVAFPSPQHLWFRQDNSSQHVLSKGASSSGLQASLSLSNVTQFHFGLYFLNVSNSKGHATFSFSLMAKSGPKCLHLLNVTSDPSNPALNVSWEHGFNNGGPRHFLVEVREGQGQWRNTSHNVTEIPLQDRYSLSLDNLQPSTDYSIRVRAYDQFGHSCYSREETGRTPGKVSAESLQSGLSPVEAGVTGFFLGLTVACAAFAVVCVILKRRKFCKGADRESNAEEPYYQGLDALSRHQPRDNNTYEHLALQQPARGASRSNHNHPHMVQNSVGS